MFTFNVLGALTNPKVQVTTTRLGVTVSKKVSKRAVDRNRIKRNVKEFYRHHKTDIHQAHLVITAKPASATASNIELQQSLEELWVKVMKWQRWHSHQLAKKAPTDNPESATK